VPIAKRATQIGVLLEQHEIALAVGRFTETLQHDRFDFSPLSDEPMRIVVRMGHALARRARARSGLGAGRGDA